MTKKKSKSAVKRTGARKQASTNSRAPGKKNTETNHFAICIGASAGGLNAVAELVARLSPGINAAIFVVTHLSKAAVGDLLASRIRKNTSLACGLAVAGDRVKPGHIYLARPDAHLLVKNGRIIIGQGPPENRFRPSIDVLFRSVAVEYRERAIGVILTGFLNDGTAGMMAIAQCGGQCVVQDPNEAEFPDMPLSVLENMEVHHCVSLKKMGTVLMKILEEPITKKTRPPKLVVAESNLSEKVATGIERISELGEKTVYACPDCGGGLWKLNNGTRFNRYRCHIGHTFSEADLDLQQSETIDQTLWVAVRMMEERKILLLKMAKENSDKGLERLSKSNREQSAQLDVHIGKLKELLFDTHD